MIREFVETAQYRRLCCSECGVVYFYPERWCETAMEKGRGWQCPNGHGQWFGEGTAEKLRRERDRAQQQVARAEEEAAEARREADKLRREAARQKKRAAAGLCPCCNRPFVALARHIATKHPDWSPKPKLVAEAG